MGRQAIPADSVPGPRSLGVDQLSRPTQSRVRAAAGSTRSSGRLRPGSEALWCRQAIPANRVLGPCCRGVHRLSQPTRTRVLELWGRPAISAESSQVRADAGWDICPEQDGPGSEVPRVDQLTWPTLSWDRREAVLTSCAGRLGPGSEVLRSRPATPANSDLGPRSCGLDQLFGPLGPVSELTQGRPAIPAHLLQGLS